MMKREHRDSKTAKGIGDFYIKAKIKMLLIDK